MNRHIQLYSIACLLTTHLILNTAVTPFLAFRSQGFNGAREIVGWHSLINKFDVGSWYGSFSVTPEYSRSFHTNRIQEWLFSNALSTVTTPTQTKRACSYQAIAVQGTKVSNRNTKALMAENFYLPPDYSSIIRYNPTIDNEIIDLNFYLGLDRFAEGMFFRIHAPVTHTRWALNMHEQVISKGSQNYDVGYMDSSFTSTFEDPLVYGMSRTAMLGDFTEYVCLGKAPKSDGATNYTGLSHARMATHALSKNGLAELTAQLGWNFCTGEGYHCGIAVRTAAPTGTRPTGRWLFEPIVGNGHHWELGGSLTTHWRSWKNFKETVEINTYVDINITHLFATQQCRTFDLWQNPLSRYMLAMRFTGSVQNLKVSQESDNQESLYSPAAQFAQEFVPLANISTIPVDVSAAVQGEFILTFALTHDNYSVDMGYNFWGRTCLDIYRTCGCKDGFIDNMYGMKGDSFAYGFPAVMADDNVVAIVQSGVPLSATQSNATVFNGCNNWPYGIYEQNEQQPWYTNPGVDDPQPAYNNNSYQLRTKQIDADNPGAPTFGWNQVNTSVFPVLLTFNDLDINHARTRGISHKAFFHFNYTWQERMLLKPYLGFGFEIEFAQNDDCGSCHCRTSRNATRTCATQPSACCIKDNQCFNEDTCKTAALSQWGIWVKGGFSFN